MNEAICKICGRDCTQVKSLSIHINKAHKDINLEDYYRKYMMKPGEGLCANPNCRKPTKFISLTKGFAKFCCVKCNSVVNRGPDYWKKINSKLEAETGCKVYSQLDSVKQKAKETSLEKYGTEFPNQSAEVKAKIAAKGCILSDPERRAQWAKDRKERTGFEYTLSNPEINKRAQATRKTKEWNVEHRKRFTKPFEDKLNKVNCELLDILPLNQVKIRCKACGSEMILTRIFAFTDRADKGISPCTNCVPFRPRSSREENEVFEFLKSIGINAKQNVIGMLPALGSRSEIDIYDPSKRIGIEYDGLYFHSEDKIGKASLLDKTIAAEQNSIRLIHIFSDEWNYDTEKVKSRLASIFGYYKDRRFARKLKCEKIVSSTEIKAFMDENHLQGSCINTFAYGLRDETGEIVAMMTFGPSRFKSSEFELLRYATKKYTAVVGGAGKLLAAFQKDHPTVAKIVSYADRRWSNGNLYRSLGFCEEAPSEPGFFVFKATYGAKRISRFEVQKHKIVEIAKKILPNMTEEELASKTADEILSLIKFKKIYDCGQLRFVKEFNK